ncbi:MAG: penicillin-binding transpeptidase domain-containing protein [Bacteroidota bacterium]
MDNFIHRGNIIIGLIFLIFMVFVIRLFSIQVLSDEYARKAESYIIRTKSVVPPRGNIYNRKGEIYVSNRPMFSLTLTPAELYIPPEDTAVLLDFIDMTWPAFDSLLKARSKSRAESLKESVLLRHIEPGEYGAMQEKLWDFSGLGFQANNRRNYQYAVGAHILGYVSEVNKRELRDSGGRYEPGDLIGKAGIERSLDTILRGVVGKKKVQKDKYSREVGEYAGGKFDIDPVKGDDILLGVDTDLQALGEELMEMKKGSIVAIEPRSGEILAFISAPTYKPDQLTGKELNSNWKALQKDSLYPLFNRPLMAEYPPGSIFKIPLALAALNEGVITKDTYYRCGGGFWRNKGKPGCRLHYHPLKLKDAIKLSCNSYFAATYMDFLDSPIYNDMYKGFETWHRYMSVMGVGKRLNVDMPYEKPGQLPAASMYDNEKYWYGRNRWSATTVISNAIGQGELLMTPLQMANLSALVANRGTYVSPHFLRASRSSRNEAWEMIPQETISTQINRQHFEDVIIAMEEGVEAGTGRRAYLEGFRVAGKTGTVQNPHGEDHSVFIGFAPVENPQIAIAVVIENAGGGGRWAAPTAGILMEQYLTQKVEQKKWEYQRIKQARFKY